MIDPIAKAEQDKYRKVWSQPGYRRNSPGARVADRVLSLLGCQPGQSITDYGCGTGKASRIFANAGLRVTAVDITETALDPRQNINFILATLWDLPPFLPTSDWAFCCDVLEHLPEEKVEEAVQQIARKTRFGGFLQPATRVDRWGDRFGERLHLTVRPGEWWLELLSPYFECEPQPWAEVKQKGKFPVIVRVRQ